MYKKLYLLTVFTILLFLIGCVSTATTSTTTATTSTTATTLETTSNDDNTTLTSINSTNTTVVTSDLSDNQTLNWYAGIFVAMSPINIEPNSTGANIVNQTFEGLVNDVEGIIQPGIAESWSVSADGLTVTFYLRTTYWSDGSLLTANDFVYSWTMSLENSPRFEWGYTNISDFEAIDDNTLVVHLTKPTPSLLSILTLPMFMPINQNMYENSNGDFFDPDVFVCNGPFKLTSFDMSRLVLEKNEHYWNASNVYLETINIWTEMTFDIIIKTFKKGEINFVSDLSNENISALEEEELIATKLPSLSTTYISLNLENQYLSNKNLRLALAYAINQKEMSDLIFGIHLPAVGIVGPGFIDNTRMDFANRVSEEYLTVNAELAVEYFETAATELGLTVTELQDVLSQMSYKYTLSEYQVEIASVIEAYWQEVLGFEINLSRPDYPIYINDKRTGEFDFIWDGWRAYYGDPEQILSIFMSDSIYNYTSYSNNQYDSLMESALNAITAEDHYENLYMAYEILLADMPVIPIGHSANSVLASDSVLDWTYSSTNIIDFSNAYIHE